MGYRVEDAVFALLPLLLAYPVFAGTDVTDAEYVRLTQDLHQLAQRQAWAGVERIFLQLEEAGAPLTYQELLFGAHAARNMGHTLDVRERLGRAVKFQGSREVIDWLAAIDANYAPVQLVGAPHCGLSLLPAEHPLDPDQRVALDSARSEVARTGSFSGLLPRGAYVFGDRAFVVEPGIALRIEVDARARRDRTRESP